LQQLTRVSTVLLAMANASLPERLKLPLLIDQAFNDNKTDGSRQHFVTLMRAVRNYSCFFTFQPIITLTSF